jgi:RimJ/RimL family protein N-acetyltransferase
VTQASFHIPRLETDRLILRAPCTTDLPRLTAFFATSRSHMVGGPRDAAETWKSLASRLGHWALKGFGLWHLTEKSSGDFIGWTGMIDAPGWDEPELGWTLLAEAEGKGLAFEAVTAARDFAAQNQNLNGVISYIAHANDRSRALAERLGARFERDGKVIGKPCQIFRHPLVEVA